MNIKRPMPKIIGKGLTEQCMSHSAGSDKLRNDDDMLEVSL